MILNIAPHDTQANRNVEAVVVFYDEMINKKHAIQATEKYLVPDYIQHNPVIPITAKALASSLIALPEQGKICV